MTHVLRNVKVGVRLGIAFGFLALLLAGGTAVGILSSASLAAAQDSVVADTDLRREINEAKYSAANVNGYQNAYVLDAVRGATNATSDSGINRAQMLIAVSDFREHLAAVDESTRQNPLPTDDSQLITGLDAFMALDEQIVALLRQGTDASVAEAVRLTGDDALAVYRGITDVASQMTVEATARSVERQQQASATWEQTRALMLGLGGLAVILAIALAVAITRSITVPLRKAVVVLKATAAGDLTSRANDTGRDEVAQLGRALDRTLDTLNGAMHQITDGSSTLSASSEELSAVSQQMSAAAEETSAQAGSVSAAAEQVSQSIQSVSAGAEQLGASIVEISSSTSSAAVVAAEAVVVAGDAQARVARLGESSAEIGEVVKVISSIAQQTNMLALNATIEAARAGEAGKGFAVVANEVKELARMTAQSTDEIALRVERIQSDSRQAVEAIGQITDIIGTINDMQIVVAASVEEQAVTTRDIVRSLTGAATGSVDIARNITGVADTAHGATQGAAETQSAATQLARLSGELLELVGRFTLLDRQAAGAAPEPELAGTAGQRSS